jgi:hypothetical protein
MELKHFVKNTIIEVVEGVYNAGKDKNNAFYIASNCVRDINFDLLIQEEEINSEDMTKSKDGSIKILKVLNVGLNGQETNSLSNKNIASNRVQFSVPIQYKSNM